jgi:hypothetical protein
LTGDDASSSESLLVADRLTPRDDVGGGDDDVSGIV